jgi:hypothetical protein
MRIFIALLIYIGIVGTSNTASFWDKCGNTIHKPMESMTLFRFHQISVGRVRSPTRRLHQSWSRSNSWSRSHHRLRLDSDSRSRVFSHHMIFLSHNKYSVYVDIEDTKARNSFNFIICVERIDFTFISIRKVRAKSPRDSTPSTPDSWSRVRVELSLDSDSTS